MKINGDVARYNNKYMYMQTKQLFIYRVNKLSVCFGEWRGGYGLQFYYAVLPFTAVVSSLSFFDHLFTNPDISSRLSYETVSNIHVFSAKLGQSFRVKEH